MCVRTCVCMCVYTCVCVRVCTRACVMSVYQDDLRIVEKRDSKTKEQTPVIVAQLVCWGLTRTLRPQKGLGRNLFKEKIETQSRHSFFCRSGLPTTDTGNSREYKMQLPFIVDTVECTILKKDLVNHKVYTILKENSYYFRIKFSKVEIGYQRLPCYTPFSQKHTYRDEKLSDGGKTNQPRTRSRPTDRYKTDREGIGSLLSQ